VLSSVVYALTIGLMTPVLEVYGPSDNTLFEFSALKI